MYELATVLMGCLQFYCLVASRYKRQELLCLCSMKQFDLPFNMTCICMPVFNVINLAVSLSFEFPIENILCYDKINLSLDTL